MSHQNRPRPSKLLWVAADPLGRLLWHTISESPRGAWDSIDEVSLAYHERGAREEIARLRREGWRVVRVRLVPS